MALFDYIEVFYSGDIDPKNELSASEYDFSGSVLPASCRLRPGLGHLAPHGQHSYAEDWHATSHSSRIAGLRWS